MSSFLRGAEIDACIHRIALARAEPERARRTPPTPEIERRREEANNHRRSVLAALIDFHPDAVVATSNEHAASLIDSGTELILNARLSDVATRRIVSVQGFIRVGRVNERFTYAPLVVKNHEVTDPASTRRLWEGSLERLLPSDAKVREGIGLRPTPTVRRDVLLLDGATRVLQAFGAADPSTRGALVDRNAHLWWLELASGALPKSNLDAYDEYYLERKNVLEALDTWFDDGGDFPTTPYWHRECLTCEFQEHCERELEAVDDVSLTRFTSIDQQRLLRSQGVATRVALAHLDPLRAVQLRAKTARPDEHFDVEDRLSRSIDRLDELIYRARAHVHATPLRILDAAQMGCPTADVEVDVDMESYADRTYLWGASVTVRDDVVGFTSEHVTFVEWGELSSDAEAQLFATFWLWFSDLRARCHEQGRSFAAYCFWAQAEDGAMNRAVETPVEGGPTNKDLEAFRRMVPTEWIDIHDVAKAQIQTEGPLGLKQLAMAAGFHWRDTNPSGEASMLWYEVATRQHADVAEASRARILEYNEDDCRATRALRVWLNGAAKDLAHRDDPV